MDSKNTSPLWKRILVITAVMVIFTGIFPRTLGSDLFIEPLGVSLREEKAFQPLSEGGFFLKVGSSLSGADTMGNLIFSQESPVSASFSDQRYSWSDMENQNLVTMGPKGPLAVIPGEIYGFWRGTRFFVVDDNRLGLGEASPATGKVQWKKDFASLITAVDAGLNLVAVGTAEGSVQVFDKSGGEKLTYAPGGSRLALIFNLGFDTSEEHLALVSGLDPKRFILLSKSKKNEEYRPVFHKPLNDARPQPEALGFLEDGKWVYFADGENMKLVNLSSYEEKSFPLAGELTSVHQNPELDLLTVLTRKDNISVLSVCSMNGTVLSSLEFPEPESSFRYKDGRMYIGLSDRLLTLEEKLK